jgi:hypothetical protein
VTRLHGNARAYPNRGARLQLYPFERKQIVAKVFSRVRHYRRPGALFKQLYA